MPSIRRLISALAVAAALGGSLAACGPSDDKAGGTSGGSAASAKPSAQPSKAGEPGDNDCGKPPTMPAGHMMVEIKLEQDSRGFDAQEAKPHCTPNDWIYGAEGGPSSNRHYKLASDVKAELALTAGPGQTKPATSEQLTQHIDGCLLKDYSVVKQPYGCFGNVYDITLNAKGDVQTIKEIWSV